MVWGSPFLRFTFDLACLSHESTKIGIMSSIAKKIGTAILVHGVLVLVHGVQI